MIKMKKIINKEALEYRSVPTFVEMFVPGYKMEQIEENLLLVKEPCGPFVHKNFGAVCMLTPDATGKLGMIIKDQFFDELPKFVQDFMIQHEIGHFKNKHHLRGDKNKIPNIIRTFGMTNKMEIKADEYAVRKVGREKSIAALQWMCKNTDLPFLSKWEMRQRISHLKKKHV